MSKPDPRKLKDEAAEAIGKGRWKVALERYLTLDRLEPRDGSWPQKAGEVCRRLGRGDEAIGHLDRAADVFAQGGFLLKAIAVCKIILEIDEDHTQTQAKLAQFYAARGMSLVLPRTPGLTAAAPATSAPATAPSPPPVVSRPAVTPPRPPTLPPRSPAPAAPRAPVRAAAAAVVAVARPAVPRTPPAAAPPQPVHTDDDDWSDVLEEEVPPAPEPEPEAPADALARKLPPGAPLAEMSLGNSVPGARASQDFPSPNVFEIPLEEEGFEAAFENSYGGAAVLPSTGIPTAAHPAADVTTPAAEAARAIAPRTPLFSALDEFRLRLLIERVRFQRVAQGDIVFRRGDPGDCLYVVAQGEVAVLGAREVEIARLGEGAFFGEIALLTNQPRSATIRATAETDLLVLDRDMIGDLVSNSGEFVKVLLRFMRDRLLVSLLGSSPLFAPFTGDQRLQLAGKFRFLEVENGALLVEQGKRSPGLFILLAGKCTAFLDGKPIVDLAPGDLIGEMSLLTRANAIATVRAASKAYLLDLPRSDFQELIMTHPQVLEFVNQLAEDRKKLIDAILSGRATYGEGHVTVVG